MPIRTGRQFLDASRDDRQVFADGERVADVARDRRFAGAARTMAELYVMQHATEFKDWLPPRPRAAGDQGNPAENESR